MGKQVKVIVFGSDMPCPSCVHQPSSTETFEWLQAAITRKYNEDEVMFEYVDIEKPSAEHKQFAEQVVEGEFFYPVVLVNDVVVGEGNPQLKRIYAELEQHGVQEMSIS
ncbi:DUF1462 family protein [Bacillus tianshenii]|nr:DUF1462 family protein [Bacillus tianshenii]